MTSKFTIEQLRDLAGENTIEKIAKRMLHNRPAFGSNVGDADRERDPDRFSRGGFRVMVLTRLLNSVLPASRNRLERRLNRKLSARCGKARIDILSIPQDTVVMSPFAFPSYFATVVLGTSSTTIRVGS